MEIKDFFNELIPGNCYIISEQEECYIVDPGGVNVKRIFDYIKEKQLTLKGIILTHGHYDHIMSIPEILEIENIPVYIGEKDYEFLFDSTLSLSLWQDKDFKLSKNVDVNKLKENDEIFGLLVIDTPGHTRGSICLLNKKDKILISGDTIFRGNVGRSDLPTGNYNELKDSIQKILSLDRDIKIYPGHGGMTTVEEELQIRGIE